MCVCARAKRYYCRCLAYLYVNYSVGLPRPCDCATRVRAIVFLGLLRSFLGSRRAPHLTTTCVRENARTLLSGRQLLPRFPFLYVDFTFGRRGDGRDGRGDKGREKSVEGGKGQNGRENGLRANDGWPALSSLCYKNFIYFAFFFFFYRQTRHHSEPSANIAFPSPPPTQPAPGIGNCWHLNKTEKQRGYDTLYL